MKALECLYDSNQHFSSDIKFYILHVLVVRCQYLKIPIPSVGPGFPQIICMGGGVKTVPFPYFFFPYFSYFDSNFHQLLKRWVRLQYWSGIDVEVLPSAALSITIPEEERGLGERVCMVTTGENLWPLHGLLMHCFTKFANKKCLLLKIKSMSWTVLIVN